MNVATTSMRLAVLTGLASLVAALATGVGHAADECRGLQVCLPVAGPWVVISATGVSKPTSTAVWDLRCPLRGYIVAGVDARVSDRGVDVSFRGETGSPVSAGVTTTTRVLFAATATGPGRRPETFRPFIGCVPSSGGGGRAATAHVRVPAAFPPARPIERRVSMARVRVGETRALRAACRSGERLVGSERSVAIQREAEPARSLLAGVRVSGSTRGKLALARASAASSLPAGLRVLAQVHALCARDAS
jgi:hypothetical protein